MVYNKYDRYDFMIVLVSLGSILSLVSAICLSLTRFFTHNLGDRSMMEKLYSVDNNPDE